MIGKIAPWVLSFAGFSSSIFFGRDNLKLRRESKRDANSIKELRNQMKENGILEVEKQEIDANADRIKAGMKNVDSHRYKKRLRDKP